jgi:hypothetical protein
VKLLPGYVEQPPEVPHDGGIIVGRGNNLLKFGIQNGQYEFDIIIHFPEEGTRSRTEGIRIEKRKVVG